MLMSTSKRALLSLARPYCLCSKVLADGNLESKVGGTGQSKVLHLLDPRDIRVHHRLIHDEVENFHPPFVAPKL